MTPADVATLLAMCAAYDQRTIGAADVAAWHAILVGYDPADARQAVIDHYTRSRDRVMPCDVLAGVRRIRAARLATQPDPLPDADPNDVTAWIAALRDGRHRIADGAERPRPVAAVVAGIADRARMP